TSRRSLGEVRYSYTRRRLQPSLSGRSLLTCTGHFASGLYAFHAAANASAASLACTSTRAIQEPPPGASRIVAGPLTRIDHPLGAMKGLPRTVAFGESAESRSVACALAAGADWACANKVEQRMMARTRDPRLRGRISTSVLHVISNYG